MNFEKIFEQNNDSENGRRQEIGLEKETLVNFLDKNLEVTYSFEQEAIANLPEITKEEIENHLERYGVLLGDFIMKDGKMRVIVKSIVQQSEGGSYWKEGVESVSVEISEVQKLIENAKKVCPEIRNQKIVGEFHTHPVMPHEYENGLKPWEPSDHDLGAVALEYANEVLQKDQPFIFGVAGPNEEGQTVYEFYKLNQSKDEVYSHEKINEQRLD